MNATTNPRFWDDIAATYAKKPVPDEAAYTTTLDRVRAHLTPNARVLEIGCGTGSTAIALAPSVGELVAIDYASEMIAIAKEKVAASRNVRFEVGTLESMRGPFDVVMGFNVLHLLEDVPAAIRRVHALLAPNGLFVSKTPCVGEESFVIRGIAVMRAFGRAPFVTVLKKSALERAIAEAGFEILETGLYPAKTHSLFVVARKLA